MLFSDVVMRVTYIFNIVRMQRLFIFILYGMSIAKVEQVQCFLCIYTHHIVPIQHLSDHIPDWLKDEQHFFDTQKTL